MNFLRNSNMTLKMLDHAAGVTDVIFERVREERISQILELIIIIIYLIDPSSN